METTSNPVDAIHHYRKLPYKEIVNPKYLEFEVDIGRFFQG